MKILYTKPAIDIVSLDLSAHLLDNEVVLRGSYEVNSMTVDDDTTVLGGDETNIMQRSLWDNE